MIEAALGLQEITDYAWWDLMIIPSAIRAGREYLVTEDMQHGQELGDLTIVNPFFADLDYLVERLGISPPPFSKPD